MTKGNGNGKGRNHYYWRNKIKNERQPPKAKFRARLKSKGEGRVRGGFTPRKPGEKWTQMIKNRNGFYRKAQAKQYPSPGVGKPKNRVVNKTLKPSKSPISKTPKSYKIKNKIIPVKRISQPIASKQEISLFRKQAVLKTPRKGKLAIPPTQGVSKLRNAAQKPQPVKAPEKINSI